MKELEWSQDFPHYNAMGAICCHGNQSSDPILPQTLYNQSPIQMMLLMKFDYDWPAGFRDIHVWKCGRMHGRTDGRIPARVPYYKLTLSLRLWWAKNEGPRVVTTLFIDFSHAQRQLTPKSVMESCRNSNPSKLLWLSLLPAGMKKIHWKMKVLEWSQRFSHYKSMGIFPNAQGQLTHKSFVWYCPILNPSEIYGCPCYLQE